MASKVSATFERYWQYKQYDGEKISLTVEQDVGDDIDPPSASAALFRRLAEIGDKLTALRLAEYKQAASKPPEAAKKPAEPGEKQPW